jgi:hypothetical protein
MRNRWRNLAVLVLAVVLGVAALTAAADRGGELPDLDRLSAAVKIEPVPGQEGTFLGTMRLTDLASGDLLSEPQVLFRKGQKATARSGFKSSKGLREVVLTLEVNAEATAATYDLSVKSDGQLMSSQQATITLR